MENFQVKFFLKCEKTVQLVFNPFAIMTTDIYNLLHIKS